MEAVVVVTPSIKVKRQGSHLETKSFVLGRSDRFDRVIPTVALAVLGMGRINEAA